MCLHTPLLGTHKYHSVRFAVHMAVRNVAEALYHCKGSSFRMLKRRKSNPKKLTLKEESIVVKVKGIAFSSLLYMWTQFTIGVSFRSQVHSHKDNIVNYLIN